MPRSTAAATVVVLGLWVLLLPMRAAAQLSSQPGPTLSGFTTAFYTDAAFDPVRRVSLAVVSGSVVESGGQVLVDASTVSGVRLDETGTALGPPMTITAGMPGFVISAPARVVYAPDLEDGKGGHGAFLVLWAERGTGAGGPSMLRGQVVQSDGTLVGAPATVLTELTSISRCAIAYSRTSRVFLAAWAGTGAPGGVHAVRLTLAGASLGAPTSIASSGANVEIAWNPFTNQFGLAFHSTASAAVALVLLDADAARVATRSVGDTSNDGVGLALNERTGAFLVVWQQTFGDGITATEVSATGEVLAINAVVTPSTPAILASVAYSPDSGTFAVTGMIPTPPLGGFSFNPLWATELGAHGQPLGSSITIGTLVNFSRSPCRCAPRLSAMDAAPDWLILSTAGLASSAPILAAWLLDSDSQEPAPPSPPSPPPPATPPCALPDPFTVLGGGVCVSGSWVPRDHPLAPPSGGPAPPVLPPSPSPGGCVGPDPFLAFGGGVCIENGWVPPGHPLAPPSAPLDCDTPDPFLEIPTLVGVCVDGGWRPVPGVKTTGMIVLVPDGLNLVPIIEGDDGGRYRPIGFEGDLSLGRVFVEAMVIASATADPLGTRITIRRLERLE